MDNDVTMMGRDGTGWRSYFSVNKKLLPLKLSLFMFSGAAYAVIPYLTIHAKDLGISDMDLALIYSILPFTVFMGPPIVGFIADKIGNYTRVNMIFIVVMGVFHTSLLFVPTTTSVSSQPETRIQIKGSEFNLVWNECEDIEANPCDTQTLRKRKEYVRIENCDVKCSNDSEINSVNSTFNTNFDIIFEG